MLKKNLNLKLIIFITFLVTYIIFVFLITQDKKNRISLKHNQQVNNLQLHYNLTIDNFLTDAKSFASIVKNNKKVIKILLMAKKASKKERIILRQELYSLLLPLYKRAKEKGVHQFQFQFTDNTTFLRMHKPEKFDDDLSEVRYSYKHTNKTKKPVYGFEQGRSSHSIRYVYPIFDKDNNHIINAEVALSTNYIQDKLIKVNKIHSHFLVDKSIFDAKTWETKHLTSKYVNSIEDENYMFSLDKHTDLKRLEETKQFIIPLKDEIKKHIDLKESFALHTQFNDKINIIAFLPIKNIKEKKVVAYLVSYTNSTQLYTILKDYNQLLLIVFIVLLIIFSLIYRNLEYRRNLEFSIKEKTLQLQDLNKNLEQKIEVAVKENRIKDELLASQAQSAALGEMMDAIAHQWKQPLGIIKLHVQSLSLGLEYGILATNDDIKDVNQKVALQVEHLVSTIDEFRSFFRPNKTQSNIKVNTIVNETILLMKDSLMADKVEVNIIGNENIKVTCSPNEFKHILINLVNNSMDAFEENNIQHRRIIFDIQKSQHNIIINVLDNAGGIPEDVITKIFTSNFTTKEEGKGTGIGLYLTKQIVEKLNATIEVTNKEVSYENIKYTGACFSITIPIS